jgi:hypothetical protein
MIECFISSAARPRAGKTKIARRMLDEHNIPLFCNDWIQDYSDRYILDRCSEMIEWSQILQVECKKYDLPYFDVSREFSLTLDKAYRALMEEK